MVIKQAPANVTMKRPSLSRVDAEKHAGRWVAIREGSVIAEARSYERLRKDPRVATTDGIVQVPKRGAAFF